MQALSMSPNAVARGVVVRAFTVVLGVLAWPVVGYAQDDVCNANRVVGSSSFPGCSWIRSGWDSSSAGQVAFDNDSGGACVSQALTGMSPGATPTFTWRYGNGNGGIDGNPFVIRSLYHGTVHWSGRSAADGVATAPASAAGLGAMEWKFVGTIAPGGTGAVLFQVKVDG